MLRRECRKRPNAGAVGTVPDLTLETAPRASME